MNKNQSLRNWMFKCLIFEADADRFRSAGIRVGADSSEIEAGLFAETLAPFPIHVRNEALRMSRLYALINCFENSVRDLIKERLMTNFPANWWTEGVPDRVRKLAESRKADAQKNSWLQGEKSDLLYYVDFGNLAQIIIAKWEIFSDLLPNQSWLTQRMDELEKTRNFIAHNRSLSSAEYARVEMYISDWNAQVGV